MLKSIPIRHFYSGFLYGKNGSLGEWGSLCRFKFGNELGDWL